MFALSKWIKARWLNSHSHLHFTYVNNYLPRWCYTCTPALRCIWWWTMLYCWWGLTESHQVDTTHVGQHFDGDGQCCTIEDSPRITFNSEHLLWRCNKYHHFLVLSLKPRPDFDSTQIVLANVGAQALRVNCYNPIIYAL